MSSSTFNPRRQYLLVRRQWALFQQSWLIAAAVVLLGLLIVYGIHAYANNSTGLVEQLQGLYLFAFVLGGFIFTSQIFKELHAPNQSYAFLTLPSSTLEKLTAAWLITSPLYILAYSLLTFMLYLVSVIIAGDGFPISYFFNKLFGGTIIFYLIFQTIFLWGACYFRKNNFLKTLLTLIIFFIGLGMFGALLAWGIFFNEGPGGAFLGSESQSSLMPAYETLTQVFFWVLGPYMLVVTYFTLKERQV